jgi:hypothetical protein
MSNQNASKGTVLANSRRDGYRYMVKNTTTTLVLADGFDSHLTPLLLNWDKQRLGKISRMSLKWCLYQVMSFRYPRRRFGTKLYHHDENKARSIVEHLSTVPHGLVTERTRQTCFLLLVGSSWMRLERRLQTTLKR